MEHLIETTIKGVKLKFKTSPGLFSPTTVDRGTLAMLSQVDFKEDDKVLDLGCGYGVVGILAARLLKPRQVIMTDIDSLAVELSRENARLNNVPDILIVQSDAFRQLSETNFTLILANPPYHVDFSVPREFIEKGFNRLVLGGRIYIVTRRELWYKNKLTAIFDGARVTKIEDYFVFCAEKRSHTYANKKK